MKRKIDWKYSFLVLALVVGFIFSKEYDQEILGYIKSFFEHPSLILYIGAGTIIIGLAHKIKYRKIVFKSTMTFNDFNAPITEIFALILYPLTLVGSLTFAKGLFFQCIYGITYFPLFSGIDLWFIGGITSYLLYMSIMELYKNIVETFTKLIVKPVTPIPTQKPNDTPN